MEMKTVTVKVSSDGSSAKVSVDGVQGGDCVDLTKSLEDAIFGMGSSREQQFTEDYYNEPDVGVDRSL
jgi:hypothetical protein